jgi:Winged helix-turn helix
MTAVPPDRGNTRRSILLGTATLAAATAFGSGTPTRVALAQQPAPAPASGGGRKPKHRLIFQTETGVLRPFRISISKQTLSRELRTMGFRKLSARPRHHARDEEAAVTFKKASPPSWKTPPHSRLAANR